MLAQRLDEVIYELRHVAAHQRSWVWRRTLLMTRSLTSALFIHGMNTGWKRMAKFQAPIDEQRFGFRPNGSSRTERLRQSFSIMTG